MCIRDRKLDDLTLYINRELPPELQKLLLFISQRAEKEEVSIYLVGGSIRDMLLGSFQPADLDIVVIPEAIPFARSINSFLKGHLQIYEPFGTASITMKDGVRLDLVTARKEFYQTPAALPQVEASGLKNDLFRRDFTINTLACSLNADSFGKLYDFFGGLKDLQAGIIRVLYHLSFVDDPLRILRAVRFEKRDVYKRQHLTTAMALAISGGKYQNLFSPNVVIKGYIPFYPGNKVDPILEELGGADEWRDVELLVEKDSPPCLIYQGLKDGMVPFETSASFKDKYTEAGNGNCAVIYLPFASHASDFYFHGYFNRLFLYYMERFMVMHR